METITSKDNSLIKEVKKLRNKKHREDQNQFLAEGLRFVEEALKSSFTVEYVFIRENILDKWNSLKLGQFINESKVFIVSEAIMKSICNTDNPQGIVAVVQNKTLELNDKNGFYVYADKVQDPGNMGTIIRTAHASGALGVIFSKGTVDIYNDKTLRSTMGSIFKIPIIEDENFNIITMLKKKGFKLIVSSLEKSECFYNLDLTGKNIIAVGNEGNGISKELEEKADIRVKIPMPGDAESLNVAIAASVMMFEVVRQNLK